MYNNIDPLVHQAALKFGYAAGSGCRRIMQESGMSEEQIAEVIDNAFAWLHEKDRLILADEKLKEFGVEWDGEKYV